MADLEADGKVTFSVSQDVSMAATPAATATTPPAKPSRSVSAATATKDGASAATVQRPGQPAPPVASAQLVASTDGKRLAQMAALIGPNGSDSTEATMAVAVAVPTVAPVVAVPVALPTKQDLQSKDTALAAAGALQIGGAAEAAAVSNDGGHSGGGGDDGGGGGGGGVGDADAISALLALGQDAATAHDQLSAEQTTGSSGTGEAGDPLVLTMTLLEAVQEIRGIPRMR